MEREREIYKKGTINTNNYIIYIYHIFIYPILSIS